MPIEFIPEKKQSIWKIEAAGHFFLGGVGTGFYMVYVLISFSAKQDFAYNWTFQPEWLAVILVTAGLFCVALEAGKPFRALYVFNRPGSSWISREAFLAVLFIITCVFQLVLPHPFFQILGAIFAAWFLLSQGFILYFSCAIEPWNSRMVPPLFLISGIYAGCGLSMINYFSSAPVPISVMLFGLLAGIGNLIMWHIYTSLRGFKKIKAQGSSFLSKIKQGKMFFSEHLVPIGLLSLHVLLSLRSDVIPFLPFLGIIAGIGILITTSLQKIRIILEFGNQRAIAL